MEIPGERQPMAPQDLLSSRAVFFAYPSRTYLKIV